MNYLWRISASPDVNKESRRVGNIVLSGPVLHFHLKFIITQTSTPDTPDLVTLEDIPGAALPAAGPLTLGHPESVAGGHHATLRPRGEVRPQRRHSWVNHERDEKDKHRERGEE